MKIRADKKEPNHVFDRSCHPPPTRPRNALKRLRRLALPWLVGLGLVAAAAADTAEAVATAPLLTAEAIRQSAPPPSDAPVPVRLRGVVTQPSGAKTN